MIYAYLRVSTDDQDLDSQKQGVDEFAKKNNWKINEYIKDEGVSGAKDPKKRQLGFVLEKLKKGDKLIAAEISRLGRDLLMVMEILNHCMKTGCIVYTVKDNYILGDDVQSKVLAFAFGLSAEIERKMIQARTREGLALRMKKGVLLGRPPNSQTNFNILLGTDKKDDIIMQYKLGVPLIRIARNVNIHREVVRFRLIDWGIITDEKQIKNYERRKEQQQERSAIWRGYKCTPLNLTHDEMQKIKALIIKNLTIPDIHKEFFAYTYKQIYDTIYFNVELNLLYREHGQKILVKTHKREKEYKE